MTDTIPQKMVKWLFHDADSLSLGFRGWLKLLRATLVKADATFTLQFFNALKEKIAAVYQDETLTPEKKEIICYNALSYLAFAHPKEGSQINMNGATYTIHKIKLTSGWFSSPYYAYGLQSKTSSILIFQGTTVPSDRGFIAGILGDTMPGGAVGTFLYRRGKHKIQSWINSEYQRTGRPVMCTGQSLGGAMSMHCHIHQPTKVDFYVLNPPTLTSREEKIYKQHKNIFIDNSTRTLKVITHRSDPVFRMGSHYLPPGTKIFEHGMKNENSLIAHAKAPNFKNFTSETPDTFADYERKKLKTWAWKIQKACLFVGALLCQTIWLMPRFIMHAGHYIRQFPQTTKPVVKGLNDSTTQQPSEPEINFKESYTASKYIESSQLILKTIGHNATWFNKHNPDIIVLGVLGRLENPVLIPYRSNEILHVLVKKNSVVGYLNNNIYSQSIKMAILNSNPTNHDKNLAI
ncbi:Uncharacterised protein [Legionella beliardensis]|uniref:Lipase n=1 Tax=Legionella beliardensis TaxID=91822 RepID=A0A378JTQ4_9GAMM|nr:hypothetical protein [Legionella beliardensis]STX55649.1 Uncharacterised protein [Legionella beliardensis]